jgi:predicted ATPase
MMLHGWCLAARGQPAAGIGLLRQGLADWQATGAVSHRPYHLALLAQALAQDGRPGEGLTALDEGLTLAAATGEGFMSAELHRLRGELLLAGAAADPGAAEAAIRQALDVARRQGARSLELRALMSLTRLCRSQGRAAEAEPMLAAAYAWFTEGLDTPDLQEARAILGPRA